ncbi:MAG: hypothetical protein IJ234_00915 [Clostridia bacterium]|nr:hypothetical protein [Clostridia bacterium]
MQRRRADCAMSFARIPCRKCLLRDVPQGQALAALIREWIDALPEARRADPDTANARLNACTHCNHLNAGVCALCGCYVEFRAAQREMRCPDPPDRWRSAFRNEP